MAKDFFEEEYDKKQQESAERQQRQDAWYNAPAPQQVKRNNKPLYIALVCVALVLCIALGWVLCTVFQGIGNSKPSGQADDILQTVIDYMKNNYYQDIPEEDWINAVEMSGTVLMQQTGDRFCQLLSPQSYYDLLNPQAVEQSGEGIFGISYVVEEGLGIYVSSITPNSNAYGKLQSGDIILKLSDLRASNGLAPIVDGKPYEELLLSEYTSAAIQKILGATHSATFHALRQNADSDVGFDIVTYKIERKVITVDKYQFIEYYFDEQNNNIPKTRQNGAAISVFEERELDRLPSDTGYIRIVQFSDYVDSLGNKHTAAEEFAEVMETFESLHLKHLVLDLKGNPGGNVDYVCEIASYLITDAKLSASDKKTVTDGDELLVTYFEMPKPITRRSPEYRKAKYNRYFGQPSDVCDIVVWTDQGSASASELLTGCLKDYQTAVQMGTTTYGKGIAQSIVPLPFEGKATDIFGNTITYNWGIYYTSASYYSPLGNNIHGKGYTPESKYNNLSDYQQLWDATDSYWG